MKHKFVTVPVIFAVMLTASLAQQFNGQQSQRPQQQFRFTGQDFPNFSQQGSQQVSNFFRPSQQQIQQFQTQQPSSAPATAIQPPAFQQSNFQNQNSFQGQQSFQGPSSFQQFPQQNFQQPPQSKFQQPQQSNFQQPQRQNTNFQQSSFNSPQQSVPTFATPQQQSRPSQPSFPVQQTPAPPQTTTSTAPPVTTPSQEQLQRQFTQQLRQRQELLQQLDLSRASPPPQQAGAGAVFLANGQKLQVLTVSPKTAVSPTPKPPPSPSVQALQAPSGLLDAVTKGVVPSGVNYEVIRQKQDGDLENIKGLPSDLPKKVTFVILEEQEDGSYKVQGVRKGAGIPEGADIAAEAAKAAQAGEDENKEVQSLIKKLQDGRLKLPSQNQQPPLAPRTTSARPTTTTTTASPAPVTFSTFSPPRPSPTFASFPTQTFANPSPTFANPAPTFANPSPTFSNPSPIFQNSPAFVPTFPPVRGNEPSQSNQVNLQVPSPTTTQLKKAQTPTSLSDALRAQGLRSMAQFLEQVGLDRALNDSAPFTMFAPTDLAFRALLLELGGADRAQAKFRASPRLLSGLLLHHVIPGSFQLTDLQDEMTGVSLAGTQLRVNVYSGTDSTFNSRKLVTINGGSISERSADIPLPGGSVAHSINKVLFPLPVGDLLTSLEADPARRFNKFVRAIKETGLEEVLRAPLPDSPDDGKTYTVFAPTDDALNSAPAELLALFDGTSTPERQAALRTLLERHLAPGTLFSEGVIYYQATSTLSPDQPIRLFNDNGIFKVNSARVVTPDIPATNGVIHAIDSVI